MEQGNDEDDRIRVGEVSPWPVARGTVWDLNSNYIYATIDGISEMGPDELLSQRLVISAEGPLLMLGIETRDLTLRVVAAATEEAPRPPWVDMEFAEIGGMGFIIIWIDSQTNVVRLIDNFVIDEDLTRTLIDIARDTWTRELDDDEYLELIEAWDVRCPDWETFTETALAEGETI